MFNMADVGQRISVFRKNAGLTQMELANRLGISYQAVSNWERGISMPDISNLSALAEILSVSIDEIISDKKISTILEHDGDNVENVSLTTDEFNAISPLLPAEKNIQLISDIKDEETVTVGDNVVVKHSGASLNKQVNISSLGLTGEELDAYARSAYEKGNAAMFAMLAQYLSAENVDVIAEDSFEKKKISMFDSMVNRIPQDKRKDLLQRAFDRGDAVFVSILFNSSEFTTEEIEAYARSAYERGNVALFSILNGYISAEKRKKYLEKAISRGNVAMASILISSLSGSDEEDDD